MALQALPEECGTKLPDLIELIEVLHTYLGIWTEQLQVGAKIQFTAHKLRVAVKGRTKQQTFAERAYSTFKFTALRQNFPTLPTLLFMTQLNSKFIEFANYFGKFYFLGELKKNVIISCSCWLKFCFLISLCWARNVTY